MREASDSNLFLFCSRLFWLSALWHFAHHCTEFHSMKHCWEGNIKFSGIMVSRWTYVAQLQIRKWVETVYSKGTLYLWLPSYNHGYFVDHFYLKGEHCHDGFPSVSSLNVQVKRHQCWILLFTSLLHFAVTDISTSYGGLFFEKWKEFTRKCCHFTVCLDLCIHFTHTHTHTHTQAHFLPYVWIHTTQEHTYSTHSLLNTHFN